MPDDEPSFSAYGIASAVLGVIAVAAVALAGLIWVQHRADVDERRYQTRVLAAAVDWTNLLINMNADTVEADTRQLYEGTVGQLNADFDAAVAPYRRLVQQLQARTTGQIDSVSIEALHHAAPPDPSSTEPQPELASAAVRTDTVLVVATSASENAGIDEPRTVHWRLRLDVSDVDGELLISRLESIR